MTKKIRCVSAFYLKILMTLLMVLDHIWLFWPGMPYWFHPASRVVMPVFCFLTAQGLVHTRDRQKYITRLLWFGVITLAGNMLLTWIFAVQIGNCILITFALSAQAIVSADQYRAGDKSLRWPVSAVTLLAATWFFEGTLLVPAGVLIFYYLRERPIIMCAVFAAASVPLIRLVGIDDPVQWMMIFAVIPILLYNGRRGMKGVSGFFLKYAFYLFYPFHLWAIYLIARTAF